MNILITGAGGFVGKAMVKALSNEYCVFQIHRTSSEKVVGKRSFVLDLTSERDVRNWVSHFVKDEHIDIVIHLAACVASSDGLEGRGILDKNISISENIALAGRILQPQLFINASSTAVYSSVGGKNGEKSLPAPQYNKDCYYGLSKYCSEVLIDFLLEKEKTRVVHLRISQIYGDGMRGDRTIPAMREQLRTDNKILVYGDGERIDNFIHVDYLVSVVRTFFSGSACGVFNVGQEHIRYYDLAKRLIREHGNVSSIIAKEPDGRRDKFQLDVDKLSRHMGSM
tara:strand:- start:750 stop:1598 length:849 start_codon:yes stop_codon:yes gene_type:complete